MKKLPLNIRIIIYFVTAFVVLLAIVSITGKSNFPNKVVIDKEEKSVGDAIPGANPVDIYLGLKDRGYTIDKHFGSGSCAWYCVSSYAGIDYNVTITSSEASSIEHVKATATLNGLEYKEIIAVKSFIQYISSFPYEGNDPAKIAQWVNDNFDNDKAFIVISGVEFTIYAPNKGFRMIVIKKAS